MNRRTFLVSALFGVLTSALGCKGARSIVKQESPEGLDDTTSNLQSKLNQGGLVRLEAGRYYSVRQPKGEKAALRIRSNTTLDLNGATLALAPGGHCSLIATEGVAENICIENGVIEGNGTLQPQAYKREIGITPTLYLMNCNRLTLRNLVVRDAYMYAAYIHGNDGVLKHVSVIGSVGGGIHVNGARWKIDDIDVKDITYFERVNCQGNPFIVSLKDSVIGCVRCENFGFGVKLQDGCENVQVENIVAIGGLNNRPFPDYLVKIQGKKDPQHTHQNRGIRIGRIESFNGPMSGLYIYFSSDVSIGTYIGRDNGKSNPPDAKNGSDILIIDSDDIHFGVIDSTGFPRNGLWLHRDCGKVSVKEARFSCGASTPCPNPVVVQGGQAVIDKTHF